MTESTAVEIGVRNKSSRGVTALGVRARLLHNPKDVKKLVPERGVKNS